MKVKKVKEKYISAVAVDDLTRTITFGKDAVQIKIRDKSAICRWCGFVCGEKYYFLYGNNVQTNLSDEEMEKLQVIYHPAGTAMIVLGDEIHVFRSNEDVEENETVLLFLARRTCAEHFAVNAESGRYIINGFTDQRKMGQALTLHQLLWRSLLPTVEIKLNNFDTWGGEAHE